MPDEPKLILKRSSLADAGFEDYNVLSEGKLVGRIFKSSAASSARSWFWGLVYGYHRNRNPAHGYEPTREAAMAAFRKSWLCDEKNRSGGSLDCAAPAKRSP
jgi:hypothetical protein